MKNLVILYCLPAVLSIIPVSCASSLLPNAFLPSQYFTVVSPNEKDWYVISESQPGESESLCLQKGHGWGHFSSDYPIKILMILRRTISDYTEDYALLKSSLYDNAIIDIKDMVNNFSERTYVDEFLPILITADGDYFYQYTYSDYFPFDSSGTYTSNPALFKQKIFLGNGIGQYYIYLPKFYKEWNTYYLFLYDQYPEIHPDKKKNDSAENADDKIRPKKTKPETSIVMAYELVEFIKGFTCIEDSMKK